ncbi:MAG: VWA domain-containing protein [Bacteroidetes bacterium]|nr:MAG: VWA domain-containing protein [Bacteroidota bacterium]
MKRLITFVIILSVIGLMQASGHTLVPGEKEIGFTGHLNKRCMPLRGGTVYLHLIVKTPDIRIKERKPMNLSVVLDRSGSMADERKIDYAKAAINSLIDQLSSEDYLSIVIYDQSVDVLVPRQRVKNKSRLKSFVNQVEPRGSTNLGGGMVEGFNQLEERVDREYINRVILLSDGLANQGITDPSELSRIASRYRTKSISLTTMGVGLDYNENMMLGLAESGGGSYYYIESPSQLASIFEQELHGLSTMVCQNAVIELSLGKGVELVDVIGYERHKERSAWLIPLGDLYSNDERELTLELNVTGGSGSKHVASAELQYDKRISELRNQPRLSVDIRLTDITAELEKGTDWDVQGKVDVALSTRKVEQAMQSLDAGNEAEAAVAIEEARSMIQSSGAITNSAAAKPMMQEQMQRLETFSKELKDESKDTRAKKKSIQYRNYQVQKKKD